ncbi:MAG: FAD-binding oxidoreductase [Alphaproteobacteria bacterium]|nr:FAD-binding oxidoreductase [Alphaproteobacteria bacterium]
MSEANYYRASANPHPAYPALSGARTADVCIVGAGFTGLSAALDLAQAGYLVIVLEAERVGYGASGRNGGQICTGFTNSMARLEKRLGAENAKRAWEIAKDAVDLIGRRVADHTIDCGLTWGYLHVADKPRQMAELAHNRDEAARYGYDGLQLLDKEALRDRLDAPGYHGGLWEPRAGHFHPLNYCLGLADAAVAAGVEIFEQSRVLSVDTGAEPSAKTASGQVRAQHMILAGNAYLQDTVPQLYRRLMPVGSYILATEPLGENRAQGLIRENDAVCDVNFIVNYFRRSEDDRLLFGGRATYSGRDPQDLFGFMRPRMLAVFPQLEDVALEYCWGGYIGITVDRMPDIGRLGPSTLYAQGFSGQGVALSGMCGRLLAEAVRGQAERFDVLSNLDHPPFPGGPLRTPALVLAMLYYRLRDAL